MAKQIGNGVVGGAGGVGKTTILDAITAGTGNVARNRSRTEQWTFRDIPLYTLLPGLEPLNVLYRGELSLAKMLIVDLVGQTPNEGQAFTQLNMLLAGNAHFTIVLDGDLDRFYASIDSIEEVWRPGVERMEAVGINWNEMSKSIYVSKILTYNAIIGHVDDGGQITLDPTGVPIEDLIDLADEWDVKYVFLGDALGISGDGTTPAKMWALKENGSTVETSVSAPYTAPVTETILEKSREVSFPDPQSVEDQLKGIRCY